MENHVEEMDLTPEELAQRKEEMLQFYKESKQYLEAQYEYENLLTKIDECRFKRAQYQVQYAMMMNPHMDGADSPEELNQEIEKESKGKKLKRE